MERSYSRRYRGKTYPMHSKSAEQNEFSLVGDDKSAKLLEVFKTLNCECESAAVRFCKAVCSQFLYWIINSILWNRISG
jgi:hypothetical protein